MCIQNIKKLYIMILGYCFVILSIEFYKLFKNEKLIIKYSLSIGHKLIFIWRVFSEGLGKPGIKTKTQIQHK